MYNGLVDVIKRANPVSHIGKIENIIGMAIEASGKRGSIGEINLIYNENEKRQIFAETVGFKDDKVLLMPYESIKGVSAGTFVKNTNTCLKIPVGDFLRGRIIDAMGRPIDGMGDFKTEHYFPVDNPLTNPLERPPIREKMDL